MKDAHGNNIKDKDGNPIPDAQKGESTEKWYSTMAKSGALKYAVIGILVVTGIAFLPSLFTKAVGDALFGWLPPEYRPMAVASCSCCCSCSCCIALAAGVYFTFMR